MRDKRLRWTALGCASPLVLVLALMNFVYHAWAIDGDPRHAGFHEVWAWVSLAIALGSCVTLVVAVVKYRKISKARQRSRDAGFSPHLEEPRRPFDHGR